MQRATQQHQIVPMIGDVVLVGFDAKKKQQWSMARGQELIVGHVGATRVAKVKTSQGILARPSQRLYLLEVSSDDALVLSANQSVDDTNSSQDINRQNK